jgi:hypothetical protein
MGQLHCCQAKAYWTEGFGDDLDDRGIVEMNGNCQEDMPWPLDTTTTDDPIRMGLEFIKKAIILMAIVAIVFGSLFCK